MLLQFTVENCLSFRDRTSVSMVAAPGSSGAAVNTLVRVQDAAARAVQGDGWPDQRWPQGPGTHVHRLVGRLLPIG